MQSDIEIAQKAKMKPIGEIAKKLGIPDAAISPFGRLALAAASAARTSSSPSPLL